MALKPDIGVVLRSETTMFAVTFSPSTWKKRPTTSVFSGVGEIPMPCWESCWSPAGSVMRNFPSHGAGLVVWADAGAPTTAAVASTAIAEASARGWGIEILGMCHQTQE